MGKNSKRNGYLEEVEQETKDCYGLKKNSAKRTKRLQEISKEYEENYLALRGIFKIRFLTSEESALKAKLTDHEQILTLMLELSKDTNVKKERRDELLDLHKRLKNSENFFKTLSVMSALNEVISPYQKWDQREDICALERAWMKEMIQRSIDNMSQSRVSDETEKHLKKIDFAARRWTKSRIHCNKLIGKSRDDAISEIIQMKMQVLNTFMKHKTKSMPV